MRRWCAVSLLMTIGTVLLGAGVAHAGGSIIDFPRSVIVGQTVSASGVFGRGTQASVEDGPWFAFLEMLESQDQSIPLGRVGITRSTGTMCCWRATVAFTVPDVPTGSYFISVRNAQGSGVGDLVGGGTVIAHTPVEGRLILKLEAADLRLHVRGLAIARLERTVEELRSALSDREATIDRQAARLAEVAAQSAQAQAVSEAPVTRDWIPPVAAVVIMLLVVAAYAVGRRRGRGTRTLVTGDNRPWTENHVEPASDDRAISSLVAPK